MYKKNFPIFATLLSFALLVGIAPVQAYSKLQPSAIFPTLEAMANSKFLADPSMIFIDASTGEVVYERNSTQARRPASVLKLLSTTSALTYIDPSKSFTTSIYLGVESKTLVINGEFDPWISLSQSQAIKMNRTSLPRLAFNAISAAKKANNNSLRGLKILYTGIFSQDAANFEAFLHKRRVYAKFVRVTPSQAVEASGEPFIVSSSPPLSTMVEFALTWSDNLLAERLARLASKASGNSFDDTGVNKTFHTVLTNFGIDPDLLEVSDGSGLSKKNRVTARSIATLLMKIRNEAQYKPIYDGLPIGGVSGTLLKRFINTAPQAVGLVHAKTGTLNGTVSLAGFVDSGDRQYIFVAIADRIPRTSSAMNSARNALDSIVGKLALPIFPVIASAQPSPEVSII